MREFSVRLQFRLDHRWAPDRMSAFLDGELRASQRSRMQRHLGECPECHRVFGGLSVVVDALRHLPAAPGGHDRVQFVTSVRRRLGDPPGGPS
jgi:anti-sigma factor RsiW